MARLVSSGYVPPGTYIGQLIKPSAGNLNAEDRACNYIGKGSRLAVGKNLGIRRSFVYDEALSMPTSAPFVANLIYNADGEKGSPSRVFDSITGVQLREDQWDFVKVGPNFAQLIISQSAFDASAIYHVDYQAVSRDVLDPIPVNNLRVIKLCGTTQDRAEFVNFNDFFVPFSFAGPTADSANFIAAPFLTSIFADAGNIGGGAAAIDVSASYNHQYNRFYELTVTAISGVSGTYTATFEWSARRYSGGKDALPPTPLHTTMTKPSFTALEAAPAAIPLELGAAVSISFDAINFSVGDKFYFNGVGPGKLEFDGRFTNSNQYTSYETISYFGGPGTGSGVLSHASSTAYTGTYNTSFRLEVTAASGGIGSRQVTFGWAQYGEEIGATSSTTVLEAGSLSLALSQGVILSVDFGTSNFAVGDVFDFDVKAPRIFYQALDDRSYTLNVSTATNPGADAGVVTGSYSTGTPEGGFGSWSAAVNLLTGANQLSGYFLLPDGVSIAVRNAMRGNINGTSYAAADGFIGDITSLDTIDWSLTRRVSETREPTGVRTDVTGTITGTPGTPYIILDNIYTSGTVSVVDDDTLAPISYVEIPNTRFLALLSIPGNTLRISYEFRGAEPSPGQLYYLTANYLRPTEFYNVPTQILTREDGEVFLGPSEVNNHLFIMNELAFDNGVRGLYTTQVYDQDGDGELTDTDFDTALNAHEKNSRTTDLCVLAHFSSLGKAMSVSERANDPFQKREQMLWVGMPISTPIGNVDTPESLVYTARRTMQVPPQSPALGTRVLVGPTRATKDIVLDSGITTTVTLDGSFVAGATSALINSFTDPAKSILRSNLAGFKTMQQYTEPENIQLGQASITWMSQQGTGVFRFEEDITVHQSAGEEFQLISATTQKQNVTKIVRREMEASLIGVVTPSTQASIALIRATLSRILLGLLGRGLMADYQDDNSNVRDFDSGKDIIVVRDTASLSKFDFFYAYFIKTPIKRLFGLYSVNTNSLSSAV